LTQKRGGWKRGDGKAFIKIPVGQKGGGEKRFERRGERKKIGEKREALRSLKWPHHHQQKIKTAKQINQNYIANSRQKGLQE